MLANLRREGVAAEHRKLFLSGVAMMTVVALLIGLSIAIYLKAFTPAVMVELRADRAGNQLSRYGDVRLHGVLVGQVRHISQDGDEAVIEVALRPAAAKAIPANVEATILPTTLFGQKYIALSGPRRPSQEPIQDGAVIPSSRVRTSVELNRVLNRLFPLLRAIRPADLNATLNALATALAGRGEQIGRTLDDLDSYLTSMNRHLPALKEDIRLLADVASTYSLAAPDLVRILRNATVTSRTVLAEKAELNAFFDDVTGMSDTATRVLGANEDSIIRLGRLSRPTLRLLDTYSPEYPCLLVGIDRYEDRLAQIFQGNRIKQYVEVASTQRGVLRQEGQAGVRRGGARALVPRPAEPSCADPAAAAARRHRQGRPPGRLAHPATTRRLPRGLRPRLLQRLQWLRRDQVRAAGRQRAAGGTHRPSGGRLPADRHAALRADGPRDGGERMTRPWRRSRSVRVRGA